MPTKVQRLGDILAGVADMRAGILKEHKMRPYAGARDCTCAFATRLQSFLFPKQPRFDVSF